MQLSTISQAATMSSREIAELVGATHDSVLKTVRRLIAEGVVFGNETLYKHPQNGQTYPEFVLDFRNTMVVASGYSAELRARIIDRWQELEAQASGNQFKVPTTFAGALRLALEQAELIEQQTALIAHQAPAVAYVEKFVKADGLIGVREAAKSLGMNQNAFVSMMIDAKLMFRENGHLQAYAPDIDAGRFVVQAGTDSTGKARASTKFTAKGLRWVASKLRIDQLFQD